MREPLSDLHDERVVRAIGLLHAWIARDHRLYEVASAVGVSHGFLEGIFKARIGVDLTTYRTFLRLDRARRLLACPALAIGEVARLSGFRRHAYFTKVFRGASGMTPTEYRTGLLAQTAPDQCPTPATGRCVLAGLGLAARLPGLRQEARCTGAETRVIPAAALAATSPANGRRGMAL